MNTNDLLQTNDAMVWAEEFCRIFAGKRVATEDSGGAVDPGLMVAWFANAMAAEEMAARR